MPSYSLPSDEYAFWDEHSQEDCLCSLFSDDDWHKIIYDIYGDLEWSKFLKEYSDYYKCYVLRRASDNNILAFIYIINEDLKWSTVTIHGGAVEACPVITRYRSYILMILALLDAGIKVRTNCSNTNLRAIRFNRSVGFVKYEESNNVISFWINKNRVLSSSIYKRLFGTSR